jgi:Ankyrin repeats (3 copies)
MKHAVRLTFVLALISIFIAASAADLDVCGIKENAPIWAAFRTPGFAVDKSKVTKDFPLPGSKIFNAAAFGYDDIVLQEAKLSPHSIEAARALSTAAAMGRLTTTAVLIGAGVSPNSRIENGLTPLYAAAQSGCSEEVKYLVSVGADVNYHASVPESVLELAITMRRYGTAKMLIKLGYHASEKERVSIKKILNGANYISFYNELFK